jgi:hypothetical protein
MSKLNLLNDSLKLLNETITIVNGINTNTGNVSKADNNFTEANRILRSAGNNKRLIESSATIDNTGLITANSFNATTRTYNGFVFPSSDGTSNQVLKTDGNGNLSFVDQSSGSSGDVTAANNLTNDYIVRGNGGGKGIQTSNARLSDSGILTTPYLITTYDVTAARRLTVGTNSNTRGVLYVNGSGPTGIYDQYVYVKNGSASARIGRATNTRYYSIYATNYIRAVEFHAHSDDRIKSQEKYITNATETLMKLKPQEYYKKSKLDSEFQEELDKWNLDKTNLQTKIDELNNIVDKTDEQIFLLSQYNEELTRLNDSEPINDEKYEAGLIAQEVFYDVPELRYIVTSGINASDTILEQPEGYGNDDPTVDPDYSNWGESPASINYINLIPFLIKGFQEQQEIINQQQTTINDLKSRIEVLETN